MFSFPPEACIGYAACASVCSKCAEDCERCYESNVLRKINFCADKKWDYSLSYIVILQRRRKSWQSGGIGIFGQMLISHLEGNAYEMNGKCCGTQIAI